MSEIPEDIMRAALDLCRTREFANDTQMAVARAILAERERHGWQPIETAPKDGSDVLCVCMATSKGFEKQIGTMAVDAWRERYRGFGQFNSSLWPATHWMPLPSPPKT